MNSTWEKAKEIFAAGVDMAPSAREGFLDDACGDDAELRREVESLLASDDAANGFLNEPAIGEVADAVARPTAFEKGRKLGQYEIVDLIAAGGMGQVYLARDTRLNRQVALKFLSLAKSGDEGRFRRFEREALAVSALNHPNILTIFELGSADELPFIATEFVNGETLAQRLRRGELDLTKILDVADQTAFALAAAHEAGIIHRDIKPENIMLRDDGIVKVLDFGLAKLVEPEVAIEGGGSPNAQELEARSPSLVNTNSSGVLGTVAYMSPEQARGSASIDGRTDIWSLGIVIYEMLAGVTPFASESAADVVKGILDREPARLSSLVDGIPPELERIAERALRKSAKDRYQRIDELLRDVRSLRGDLDFRSKLEEDFRIRLKIPRNVADRRPVDTSLTQRTQAVSILNDTNEPRAETTAEAPALLRPRTKALERYRRPVLLSILTASLVAGGLFLGSAYTSRPQVDVFTVDTAVEDRGLNACTPAPNDCSIVGAIANSFAVDRLNTIEFDEAVFDSHKTINLNEGFAIPKPGKLTVIGPPAGVTLSLTSNFTATNPQNPVTRLFALFEPDMELEIRNLTLTGGSSFQGGGIHIEKGTLTVINSVITGNSSTEAGGGITNRLGRVTLIDSTVTSNNSLTGGGIANINGTMTLINTIVADNKAPLGGGVRNERGTLTLINSTVSDNSASSGGGIFNFNGTTNLYNSIIANSRSGGDCLLYNDTINADHSLIEDGLTCVNGTNRNNLTGDPKIGSKAGGSGTNSIPFLLPGSVAIDAGNIVLAIDPSGHSLTNDRRGPGFSRIVGGNVDIGAFEYQSPTKQSQCELDGWKNYSNPLFADEVRCFDFVLSTYPT